MWNALNKFQTFVNNIWHVFWEKNVVYKGQKKGVKGQKQGLGARKKGLSAGKKDLGAGKYKIVSTTYLKFVLKLF